jgi:hypothetical protein
MIAIQDCGTAPPPTMGQYRRNFLRICLRDVPAIANWSDALVAIDRNLIDWCGSIRVISSIFARIIARLTARL